MPKKKSAKTSARKVEEKSQVVETQGVEAEKRSAKKTVEVKGSFEDASVKVEDSNVEIKSDLKYTNESKSIPANYDTLICDLPVKVKKLHEDSKLPVRAHTTDAGIDLFTYEEFTLEMLERKLVGTGVAIQIPDGHVGFIKEKSGLANKGLEVKAGVIDQYRGEIEVLVKNPKGFAWKDGKRDGVGGKLSFKKGEKIAQMVIIPVNLGEVIEVDKLDESDRGESGFGSTGDE